MSDDKRVSKFDKQAKLYEKGRYNATLASWRKRIIPSARGKVLEVGVGVGANFPYYGTSVDHITAVDFSAEMIKHASRAAKRDQVNVSFLQKDLAQVDFEPQTFDTIVSTLTVCGYEDPLATLQKYGKWCKDDGMILFLEHGLSSNGFLAVTQKMINPLFKKIGGCECNRDISHLIESAGLEIVKQEHFWSEIVSLIWARPIKPINLGD